jgi:hypothetical protein
MGSLPGAGSNEKVYVQTTRGKRIVFDSATGKIERETFIGGLFLVPAITPDRTLYTADGGKKSMQSARRDRRG